LVLAAAPPARHQMAIGIWGAAGALAAAAGPTIGALLVDGFGWRAVFLINIPVIGLALALGRRWLPETPPSPGTDAVDLISVPLAGVGVGALVLGIVQGETWGWSSAAVIGSFVVGLVLMTAFVVRSSRHPAPLFDLGLYRLRSYAVANVASVFFAFAFFGWLVPLPTLIQSVWGWSVLARRASLRRRVVRIRCRAHDGVPDGDRPWHRRCRRRHRAPDRRCRGARGLRGLLVRGCRCICRRGDDRRCPLPEETGGDCLTSTVLCRRSKRGMLTAVRSHGKREEARWSTPPRPRSTRHGPCLPTTPGPGCSREPPTLYPRCVRVALSPRY
ncbi:MAG: MFS transporter, partial [Actinobacteria bacterium]|nr:MFS transporter [Actinomycetota bacterium]